MLGQDNAQKLLENFFNNNFNEPVHEQYRGLLEDIQNLLLELYKEISSMAETFNGKIKSFTQLNEDEKEKLLINPVTEALNQVYACLRFIHFINSKSDE
jgi:hypothetical protein